MTSLTLALWKDIGYQDGSVIVPSATSELPTPDYAYEPAGESTPEVHPELHDLHPATGSLFSSVRIKGHYTDFMDCSYLLATYTFSNDTSRAFYGWIDSVSLQSDKDNPITVINWHVDLWRTYYPSASYGYGMVRSRPASDTDPPQSCSYRYRLPGDFKSVIPDATGTNVNWLVFTYTKETEDSTSTDIRTCVLPIDRNNLDINYTLRIGDNTVTAPSLTDIVTGRFTTDMKISATQVTSAFISPIPPIAISDYSNNTFTLATTSTTTTDTETSDFDDTKVNRVVSILVSGIVGSNAVLRVVWSDGTDGSVSENVSTQLKNYLDTLNGVTSGNHLYANGTYYTGTVAELMSAIFPTQVFQDGDTVTFHNVTDEHESTCTVASGNVHYNVTIGTLGDKTYTYSNGWTANRIWSDRRITGLFTYTRESSQFSVDVETLESATKGYAFTKSQNFYEYVIDNLNIKTDDKREYIMTDMTGQAVGAFPWGLRITKGRCRIVSSSVSAYIQYRFASDALDSATSGLEFTIPLQPIDIASNSWVDYVYSGQRDYDISQRKIASQQALVNGITSTFTGGVSNYAMSSIGYVPKGVYQMTEGYNPSSFGRDLMLGFGHSNADWTESHYMNYGQAMLEANLTPIKGGMRPRTAAMATLGAGIGGALIDYASAQYFNGRLQKAEDTLQAKQFDNITVSGNGWDWLWHGRDIGIVTLVPDDYSIQRFDDDKRLNGIYCSEPMEDCTSLISAGGPLQIDELVVLGNIPVEARSYIKGRFANGVRIQ